MILLGVVDLGRPTSRRPSTMAQFSFPSSLRTSEMVNPAASKDAASLVEGANVIVAVPVNAVMSTARSVCTISRVLSSVAGGGPEGIPDELELLVDPLVEVGSSEHPMMNTNKAHEEAKADFVRMAISGITGVAEDAPCEICWRQGALVTFGTDTTLECVLEWTKHSVSDL